MLISTCGAATCGKDTLFKILNKLNQRLERFAFADDLKLELDQFTREKFGISAFTIDPKEKEIIRPLMVLYGTMKRNQTNGAYWLNLLKPKIKESLSRGNIPCITDCRFENEVNCLKSEFNGILIHITKLDKFNNQIPPANEDERKNDPILKDRADYKLVWPTNTNTEFLEELVKNQLKDLVDKIN